MKNLTDFRKTVETGLDPRLIFRLSLVLFKPPWERLPWRKLFGRRGVLACDRRDPAAQRSFVCFIDAGDFRSAKDLRTSLFFHLMKATTFNFYLAICSLLQNKFNIL